MKLGSGVFTEASVLFPPPTQLPPHSIPHRRGRGLTSTCPLGKAAGAVTSGSRGAGQRGGHRLTLVQDGFKIRNQEAVQATGTRH